MTTDNLSVLDGSGFPLVRLDVGRLAASGIDAMIADFETLLADGKRFALSVRGRSAETKQAHDDQKRWILWLKENRSRMAAFCLGFVTVRDAATDRAVQDKQIAGLQAMLGFPALLAEDAADADRITAGLLA
ncbi:hypothetical protein [Martelella mangrovi]|uniref:Uncharacterized protein n=1 Tax=Martelella mangrovi TaxID=1397477 RepID=A0ABV2IDS6_9HYPH